LRELRDLRDLRELRRSIPVPINSQCAHTSLESMNPPSAAQTRYQDLQTELIRICVIIRQR
jgi:hypothetical protein